MNTQATKALIVRPEPSRGLGAYYRNLGLTMLASHARRAGFDVSLVDLTFDTLDPHLDDPPAAALFSLYIDDFSRGIELATAIKQAHPGTVTAVGGPHATLLRGSTFAITDAFDVVGVGDCLPEAMVEVRGAIEDGPQPARRLVTAPTSTARMDSAGPDYSSWRAGRYFPVFPVELSRGCRQHCPFCTDPVLRRGVAVDPVERTLDTIRRLVGEHGRIWIRFVDSSLSSLRPDLDQLLDGLIEADLPVQWSAYAYPHDIDPGLAERMARSGCVALFLGIESLSTRVRTGKHHTKNPAEIARAIDTLHEHGIFVHANFIIGLPGETPETVAGTLAAARTIAFDSIGGGPFYLTPGSTFERLPHKHGIRVLDPDWPIRQHERFYEHDSDYFRTATLTQADMRELTRQFRAQVEDDHLACWNLSDYALLCWLSAGGRVADLRRLWQATSEELDPEQRTVIDILKEKTDATAAAEPSQFTNATATVAARASAGGSP